jgi:hypothetical protein
MEYYKSSTGIYQNKVSGGTPFLEFAEPRLVEKEWMSNKGIEWGRNKCKLSL